jgi:hypothetical protein
MGQPPSWLNDLRFDGRFTLSGRHPDPSSREVASHGFWDEGSLTSFFPPFSCFFFLSCPNIHRLPGE